MTLSIQDPLALATFIKQHDYDHYLLSLFVPEDIRQKFHTLCLFNYELSKIATTCSEPMTGFIRFQWWREAIEDLYDNDSTRNHETLLLFHKHQLPSILSKSQCLDYIEAKEHMIEQQEVANDEDFTAYLQHQEGTFYQLSSHLFEKTSQEELQYAKDVGMLYTTVKLIRTLPSFASKRKILLPQTRLKQFELTSCDLIEGRKKTNSTKLIEQTLIQAQQDYKKIKKHLQSIPYTPLSQLAILADSHIRRYKSINYNIFDYHAPPHSVRTYISLLYHGWKKTNP